MKVFIASLLILIVMIAGGVAGDIYLQTVSADINAFTDRIDRAAEEEDFETVQSVYGELIKYWDKNEILLTALVDHAHTVEIEKSMKEMEMSLAAKEGTEVLLSSAKVRMEITSIAENEHFHLKNIL